MVRNHWKITLMTPNSILLLRKIVECCGVGRVGRGGRERESERERGRLRR